jgi:hypothetical protein
MAQGWQSFLRSVFCGLTLLQENGGISLSCTTRATAIFPSCWTMPSVAGLLKIISRLSRASSALTRTRFSGRLQRRSGAFVDQVAGMQGEAGYIALLNDFGVRRTSPDFWAFSDALQRDYVQQEPVTGAILDYNRFENR